MGLYPLYTNSFPLFLLQKKLLYKTIKLLQEKTVYGLIGLHRIRFISPVSSFHISFAKKKNVGNPYVFLGVLLITQQCMKHTKPNRPTPLHVCNFVQRIRCD